MKLVTSTLLWVSLLSVDVSVADVSYVERIDELVLQPLEKNGKFWHVFSRARVLVPTPELRLFTSAPRRDAERRDFVPFRVASSTADEAGRGVELTGCYYPESDVAFVWDDFTEAHVPIDEHPLLTLRLPGSSKDASLCTPSD